MAQGYIYVLINPSMKDLVKIGKTKRSPEERAAELSKGTGVPSEYFVAFDDFVTDCDLVERLIHTELAQYRISKDREFFKIPLKTAINVVSKIVTNFQIEKDAGEKKPKSSSDFNADSSHDSSNKKTIQQSSFERESRKAEIGKIRERSAEALRAYYGTTADEDGKTGKHYGRLKGTQSVELQCCKCKTRYSVTLRRPEDYSVCPVCLNFEKVSARWE